MKMKRKIIPIILALALLLSGCSSLEAISKNIVDEKWNDLVYSSSSYDSYEKFNEVYDVGDYNGSPFAIINDNIPQFEDTSYTESFEVYGKLDSLGRCTTCVANIGTDIMPTEERGYIGDVKPTGWQKEKYDCVSGKYLYNRCHLIGYQLSAENANERNLITGTRYLNVEGMLPFENMVADYVSETNNHVLYRVTPIFYEDELVARGVQMEAYSIEDNGEGVEFNIYCYNAQPDIEINYSDGTSKYVGEETSQDNQGKQSYIININTKKFHKAGCSSLNNTKDANKKAYKGYRDNLIKNGYSPCSLCNP